MIYRVAHLIPVFAGLLLAVGSATAAGTGDVKTGKLVYQRYCLSCHGAEGNGQGEAAEYMSVKPRDYRQGTYKWRTTPSGSLPLDSDLEHTLLNGLYATYMPTWRVLDERSRRDVKSFSFSLAPVFEVRRFVVELTNGPPCNKQSRMRPIAQACPQARPKDDPWQ